jgi:hypothetical protein
MLSHPCTIHAFGIDIQVPLLISCCSQPAPADALLLFFLRFFHLDDQAFKSHGVSGWAQTPKVFDCVSVGM